MPRRRSSTPTKYPGKQTDAESSTSKPQRRSAPQSVLQEIHALQSSTGLLIPKSPFARLIREVLLKYLPIDYRMTAHSVMALQEASEIYMVQMFEDAYLCCKHRNRVTLVPNDMRLALFLREKLR